MVIPKCDYEVSEEHGAAKFWERVKLTFKKLLVDHDTTKATNSTIERANNLQGIQKFQARALIRPLRGMNRQNTSPHEAVIILG